MELLEKVFSKENMHAAYKAVWKNQGSAGVDGMGVDKLLFHLTKQWEGTKLALLNGNYHPKPVLVVNIDKENGGRRLLGIPTVVDRLIQQAMHQVLSPVWDKEFSDYSYGFRPHRNAGMAIKQAQSYINSGYANIVDIDLIPI